MSVYESENDSWVTRVVVVDPDDPADPLVIEQAGAPWGGIQIGPDGKYYLKTETSTRDGWYQPSTTTTHVLRIDPADLDARVVVDVPGMSRGQDILFDDDHTPYLATNDFDGNGEETTHFIVLDFQNPENPTIVTVPGQLFRTELPDEEGVVHLTTFHRDGDDHNGETYIHQFDLSDPSTAKRLTLAGLPTTQSNDFADTIIDDGGRRYFITQSGEYSAPVSHLYIIDRESLTIEGVIDFDGQSSYYPFVVGPDGTGYKISQAGDEYLLTTFDPDRPERATTVRLDGYPDLAPAFAPDGKLYLNQARYVYGETGQGTYIYTLSVFDPLDPEHPTVIDLPGYVPGGVVLDANGVAYQTVSADDTDATYVLVIDPTDATRRTVIELPGGASTPVSIGPDGNAYQVHTTYIRDDNDGYLATTHVTVIDPRNLDDRLTVDLPGAPIWDDGYEGVTFLPDGRVQYQTEVSTPLGNGEYETTTYTSTIGVAAPAPSVV